MHAELVDGTLQSFLLASNIIGSLSSYRITPSCQRSIVFAAILTVSSQVAPELTKDTRAQSSRGKTLNSTGSSMLKEIGLPSA